MPPDDHADYYRVLAEQLFALDLAIEAGSARPIFDHIESLVNVMITHHHPVGFGPSSARATRRYGAL